MSRMVVGQFFDFMSGKELKKAAPNRGNFDKGQQQVRRQKEQERRLAAERVTPWGNPQPDDYDFGSWAKGTSKELLDAGCIYEYARESRKLRCLVVLISAEQKRGKILNLTYRGLRSFEGLLESDARRTLGGALYWLTGFADQLADNKSFAELLRTGRDKVKRSLTERPLDFSPLKAIKLAIAFFDQDEPWPWQSARFFGVDRFVTFTAKGPVIKLPERHVGDHGSENIAIQIRWGDFTNEEIGEEMKKFARTHRPQNENCKEPRRKRPRRQITMRSYLKALSVMRIYKHERNQWKRLKLVAKVCGYRGCVRELAAYNERRKQGRGDEPMGSAAKVEMSSARADALKFFQSLFPGEEPLNF